MPLSCNFVKMNGIQFCNYLPKLVDYIQEEQYSVVTEDVFFPKFWISKNVQFWHMCGAFRFWNNFGWPKIWAIYVGLHTVLLWAATLD